MKKKTHELNMTEGPIIRNLLLFAVPLLFTGILQLGYNAIDIVVVGRFAGKQALAAVGSTGAVINLIITLLIGLSVGTSVVIANQYGADDLGGVSKTTHTSIAIALIAGTVLGLFGALMSKSLLVMMRCPLDVVDLAATYMRIYFLGMPATMLTTFASAIMRAVGDTKRPLIFMALSGVLNVVLNLVFVIVFHLSVAGVAYATVIASCVSALLMLRSLTDVGGKVHLSLRRLAVDWESLKKVMHIGLPAGFESAMFSISNVLLQSTVNSFGSTVMAGNAVAMNIEGFAFIVMNSVTQASLTFVSQNRGACQYDRIRHSLKVFVLLVIGLGLMIGLLFNLFGEMLAHIYTRDPEVIASGMIRLREVITAYFTMGLMNVLSAQLRGMGKSLLPMLVSVSGICGFRLMWLFIAFPYHPTLEMLYLSYPLSWALTGFVHYLFYRKILYAMPAAALHAENSL